MRILAVRRVGYWTVSMDGLTKLYEDILEQDEVIIHHRAEVLIDRSDLKRSPAISVDENPKILSTVIIPDTVYMSIDSPLGAHINISHRILTHQRGLVRERFLDVCTKSSVSIMADADQYSSTSVIGEDSFNKVEPSYSNRRS
mgnify:CR=1 FL=1